ncbi:MAG TPA: ABC transporter ATP-binding protein [Candidatus Acidoferrum sp.]|nr:ABC transporter ATP-binding protein [Candidatus Acidoferrum sp.]
MSFLSISHISRSYGAIKAVEDFSLEVERGEVLALVGPDGAGKTTLIRVLCNLLDADSGSFSFDGADAFANFETIKPLLGYMPQNFSLYPDLSVEENLTFYAGIYGLTGAAFHQKRDYLYTFSNLAPFAKRRASALSGGMKQKLALSCALVHDPKLLILDEPTTGVDPLSRRQFWEILLELKREGTTMLVTTPYMDEVAHADRAAFIFNGSKLSEGTPAELAAQFVGQIFFLNMRPAPELLKALQSIEGLGARRFGAGMHVYLKPGDRVERFADQLKQTGVDVNLLTPIEPELEDRFIQLMETKV